MEIWFTILLAGCLAALVKASLDLFISSKSKKRTLPPGPRAVPLIGRALWLLKSFSELEPILRSLRSQFGPIVALPVGPRPAIIVSSRTLAHQALVHMGAVFADRPKPLPTSRIVNRNQHNISSASYGPNWRLLRRNLTSEILHPSRVKSYSPARKWVLDILLRRFREDSTAAAGGAGVKVMDHFQFAMFCLLVVMCFGDKQDESQIRDIETVQRRLLVSFGRFQILNFWPWLTKIVLRRRWEELLELTRNQDEVLVPLIRARKQVHAIRSGKPNGNSSSHGNEDEGLLCYADTLMELELEEEDGKRKMTELEMVSVCSEFLNAGTDTTSTALQWIMANLVKYPSIQEKLYEEIKGVVGSGEEEVTEELLCRMPYLKAVILEGLRRHPPGHFVLPHAVTREVELGGYTVPKNATINFMVAEMGWDPEEWEDPMEFKPERFLMGKQAEVVEFDVTGSREIKMMPFGVGRRICPGSALAMLHLEYFVANLVWNFEWKAVEGDDVDLSEKQEFTIVMKHPLRALLSPRLKSMS